MTIDPSLTPTQQLNAAFAKLKKAVRRGDLSYEKALAVLAEATPEPPQNPEQLDTTQFVPADKNFLRELSRYKLSPETPLVDIVSLRPVPMLVEHTLCRLLGDLAFFERRDILDIQGIGPRAAGLVLAILDRAGVTLRQQTERPKRSWWIWQNSPGGKLTKAIITRDQLMAVPLEEAAKRAQFKSQPYLVPVLNDLGYNTLGGLRAGGPAELDRRIDRHSAALSPYGTDGLDANIAFARDLMNLLTSFRLHTSDWYTWSR